MTDLQQLQRKMQGLISGILDDLRLVSGWCFQSAGYMGCIVDWGARSQAASCRACGLISSPG